MKFLIITLLVAYASADVSHILSDANAVIETQQYDIGNEGEYRQAFKTSNGISASAQGSAKSVPGAEGVVGVVQGEASHTSPEGEIVSIQYSADENGYQVQGSHIPVPPPIPELIQRSLDYIRAHPPPVDRN